MELKSHFKDFLADIRLTPEQRADCEEGHTELRNRLKADGTWGPRIVNTFLQGSYRRSTAVRPLGEARRADVDVVVVTRLDHKALTPRQVVDELKPFLDEHYSGLWEEHARSILIRLPGTRVELDLVLTAAPSETQQDLIESAAVGGQWTLEEASDWRLNNYWRPPQERADFARIARLMEAAAGEPEWQTEPLRIPARDLGSWVRTDPLAQIRWTRDKNAATNGHFVNVVKSVKWWRVRHSDPKYPKGYPLEHLLGQTCDDGIGSVAQGLTQALEAVRDRHAYKPAMPDHGVPENDVFARVSDEDYAAFHTLVREAASLARRALNAPTMEESARLWSDLLGPEFDPGEGGFSERKSPTIITTGRFGARPD